MIFFRTKKEKFICMFRIEHLSYNWDVKYLLFHAEGTKKFSIADVNAKLLKIWFTL